MDAKAGHTLYSEYQQAPRAKIFRRDQGKVADLTSMQWMMRCVCLLLFLVLFLVPTVATRWAVYQVQLVCLVFFY